MRHYDYAAAWQVFIGNHVVRCELTTSDQFLAVKSFQGGRRAHRKFPQNVGQDDRYSEIVGHWIQMWGYV